MKLSLISMLTVTGLIAGGIAHAGNNPNSTRTLTGGIGGGAYAASVPSSHPYTSRSQGYSYSGHSRSDHAARSIDYFRGGNSGGGSRPERTAYGSRPESFPGQGTASMNPAALDRVPDFSTLPSGGGKPDSVPPAGTGMPSGINTGGIPTSIPPVSTGMPSGINTGSAPTGIPPVSTGMPPSMTPPAMPAASSAMPTAAVDAAAAGLANRGGAGRR